MHVFSERTVIITMPAKKKAPAKKAKKATKKK